MDAGIIEPLPHADMKLGPYRGELLLKPLLLRGSVEFVKMEVRAFTISYSKQKGRIKKDYEEDPI